MSKLHSVKDKVVCITGASSGIGAGCAVEFAKQGSALLLVARRKERIDKLAQDLSSQYRVRTYTIQLDVRDQKEVEKVFSSLPSDWKSIDILVNNAGLGRGFNKLQEGDIQDWEEMIDTNLKGLLYVTRAVLPGMVKRNSGHVINIGSISGHQTSPGGNVYCATKFAVKALTRALKMDLLGTAVRVTSVDPARVDTEFTNVMFRGDIKRASEANAGITRLTSADVAEIVVFCATRPPHVSIQELIVTPTDMASVTMIYRASTQEKTGNIDGFSDRM